MIAETVINQKKDLSIRSGIGKNGVQFSVAFSKSRKLAPNVNLTVSSDLKYSRKVCGHK